MWSAVESNSSSDEEEEGFYEVESILSKVPILCFRDLGRKMGKTYVNI